MEQVHPGCLRTHGPRGLSDQMPGTKPCNHFLCSESSLMSGFLCTLLSGRLCLLGQCPRMVDESGITFHYKLMS